MKRKCAIVLFSTVFLMLTSLNAFATPQSPETLLYKGEKLYLYDIPLDSYFNNKHPEPDLYKLTQMGCSSEKRGYHGTWEVRDGYLYLIDLQGPCEMPVDQKVLLSAIFNETTLPVRAVWLTGSIHALYNNKMLELKLESGKLIGEEIKDWPPSKYNYQIPAARSIEYWQHDENMRKASESK